MDLTTLTGKQTVFVHGIAIAMSQMEGFPVINSRARRNNNPGNIRDPGPHRIWPAYPIDEEGFLQLPTPMIGWNLLYHQILENIERGLTLYEFFAGKPGVYGGYAPSSDNNRPLQYASFVATRMGNIPLNTPLTQLLLPADPPQVG
jgi:hypothetical protein